MPGEIECLMQVYKIKRIGVDVLKVLHSEEMFFVDALITPNIGRFQLKLLCLTS